MKKTTKYSRKRASGYKYNAATFLNVIARCQTYTDAPIIGGMVKKGTSTAANMAELRAQAAASDLINHNRPIDPEEAFDVLSHALGVSVIRAIQIEPVEEKNPALPVLKAGTLALERSIARHESTGAWGMDAPGKLDLADAIEVYVQILRSSSPAQMTKASDERNKIILAMYTRQVVKKS